MIFGAILKFFSGLISAVVRFVAENWRWVLPLLAGLFLWWYITSLQDQRDKAINELADFKQQVAEDTKELEAENEKKIHAGAKLSTDIQTGATNAIKSVYEYYRNNPNVVYRDGMCRTAASGSGQMSKTSDPSRDSGEDSSNDGHPTTGNSIPIQVIEPNIAARCADTTIQALECKKYVEGLSSIFN